MIFGTSLRFSKRLVLLSFLYYYPTHDFFISKNERIGWEVEGLNLESHLKKRPQNLPSKNFCAQKHEQGINFIVLRKGQQQLIFTYV